MRRILFAVCGGLLVACLIGFGITFGLAAAGAEPLSSAWAIAPMVGTFTALGLMNAGGRRRGSIANAATRQMTLAGAPAPGTARLLVFREGRMGGRNFVRLLLDGNESVQLISPQFTALTVAPGRHAIQAALAGVMNKGSVPAEATLDLTMGETAVFKITLTMRLTSSDVVLTRMNADVATVNRLASLPMVMASQAAA